MLPWSRWPLLRDCFRASPRSAWWNRSSRWQPRWPSNRPKDSAQASLAHGAPAFVTGEHQVVPVPAEAAKDLPDIGSCVQNPQSTQIKECEFGGKDATYTVALVGDSHAAHWFEALNGFARSKGWKVVTYLKNSCPFSEARPQGRSRRKHQLRPKPLSRAWMTWPSEKTSTR
ncbi:SGNH hydrolase domain-containing protein [Glutamicibacter halophytocola]|uniref:SGNH hydrolase domain-containing protein n=1 Tax=Glutamicibacter halophytocola TaxID=1933880 RepID=UPI00321AFABC